MKIVSRGKVLNSREFYQKKTRKRRIQLILLLIIFVSIISLLIYFSRQERFLISEVTVLGENVVDKEEITQTVKDILVGKYYWLIPKANRLVYPRSTIELTLIDKFPRLKSVNLNLNEGQVLITTVDERIPFALYCLNISSLANSSDCFFLDEEGLIFAPAPSFSSGVYFIYVTKDPIENPIGKRFLSIEEFKSLHKFLSDFFLLGIQISMLEIDDDEYQLYMANNGQIMWQRKSNLSLLYSNLEAFLSNSSIKAQGNFLDKILYLDLRTENKVFYKFK